jgi:hypothetical protein
MADSISLSEICIKGFVLPYSIFSISIFVSEASKNPGSIGIPFKPSRFLKFSAERNSKSMVIVSGFSTITACSFLRLKEAPFLINITTITSKTKMVAPIMILLKSTFIFLFSLNSIAIIYFAGILAFILKFN